MHYTHFGKPADVFKHLNLCEILLEEAPEVYVETNAAYASYALEKNEEKEYGIYYFLNKAEKKAILRSSSYYINESRAISQNTYYGSPGLVMNIIGNTAKHFYFFDVVHEALINIEEFALNKKLSSNLQTLNQDSILGTINLLPFLPPASFFHIDPYSINQPGKHGYTYLDVFKKATELEMKCILWYGFNTLKEKEALNNYIINNLSTTKGKNLYGIEWIMNCIQQDYIPCNPGILGSGLLTSNLSSQSIKLIKEQTFLLEKIYKGKHYKQYDGGYYSDQIIG